MDAKSIIKKGSVKLKVKHEGILQNHTFTVEKEKTPFGEIPFLITELDLPKMELIRIATELGLPVKSATMKVFPPGKMPMDLVKIK